MNNLIIDKKVTLRTILKSIEILGRVNRSDPDAYMPEAVIELHIQVSYVDEINVWVAEATLHENIRTDNTSILHSIHEMKKMNYSDSLFETVAFLVRVADNIDEFTKNSITGFTSTETVEPN